MRGNPSEKYGKSASIKIAPFDGSYVKTLATQYWKEQQSLVVTREGGVVTYAHFSWGDLEFQATEMDGENSYIGFAHSASKYLTSLPSEIAIDPSLGGESWQERIYWINNNTSSVEVLWEEWQFSSYKHAALLTHPSLAHAGGLSVLDSRLFWTDRDTGRLWTANSMTGEGVRQLPLETGGGAVRVLHPWLQPPAAGTRLRRAA